MLEISVLYQFKLIIFQKPCCEFCWNLHHLPQSVDNVVISIINYDKLSRSYDDLFLGATFLLHRVLWKSIVREITLYYIMH